MKASINFGKNSSDNYNKNLYYYYLSNTYNVPDTVLSALHISIQQPCETRIIIALDSWENRLNNQTAQLAK